MASPSTHECEGIVLAAGRSRRAGAFKPALVVAGSPLLVHAVRSLQAACRRVVVVVGHEADSAAALVAGLPGVAVAVNERHRDGMFTSVQAGVRAVGPECAGFFVLPADCPVVPAEVPAALMAAFAAHGNARPVVPTWEGRGGHPVLVPGSVRTAILDAGPGVTLRDVLAAAAAVRAPVATPTILTDVDTPADFARLRAELEGT